MIDYPKIVIPAFAYKSFYEFTKKEAKDYLKWFLEIEPERLSILINKVKESNKGWKPDFSRKSLVVLYKWFCKNIEPGIKQMKK